MIKKLLLFFTFISIMSGDIFAHEYHVSITEIKQNKDGKLEISIKLFIDDFERALKNDGINQYIGDDLEDEKVKVLITNYIDEHFSLKANGEVLSFDFLGTEWEKDLHSFYVYLESENTEPIVELEIYNSIFIAVAPEQENMHHINIAGKKQSAFLNRDTERIELVFQ